MQELIKLITRWADFIEHYPEGTAEDFCRYFLSHAQQLRKSTKPSDNKGPMDLDSRFLRAITRTAMSLWLYMRIALKQTEVKTLENFTFMASLSVQGEARKSDVINYAMIEFSTGIEILNRLIKSGMITERIDPDDKRGRLLRLTEKGKENLKICFKKTNLAKEILLNKVNEEDKKIGVLILEPIQTEHAVLSVEGKSKTIEEIHQAQVTAVEK